MDSIAELLKNTREESGINLAEVSKDLEIEELSLKNIEEGKIGSFKDIFILKENVYNYAKYLGLDENKIIDEFNQYLFEYTSKIPVEEIEKTIEHNTKEEMEETISSPYTSPYPKNKNWIYVVIYILIFVLVVCAIYFSVSQMTMNGEATYIISYRK